MLADRLGCKPVDVDRDHHPRTQIFEPEFLDDEAVV